MIREGYMKNACLFIAAVIISVLFSGSSYADITYKVRKGDNPYTIAKKFRVSHTDIMKINAIDPDRLKPGMKITIPSQKKNRPRKVRSQAVSVVKDHDLVHKDNAEAMHHEAPSFHVVKKGDTISSLARTYSIPQHKLIEMNGLRSHRLKIGQQIAINRGDASDYTVQKGDTIWSIAQRFDLEPDDVLKINSLESDSLKPGQKILLRHQTELTEIKPYEAILSQAHEENTHEQLTEHQSTIGSGLQERLILFAKKMLDIPYRFGGNSLLGIDCSAYVKKVYSLIGVDLPRSAREQFHEGIPVDESNLSIGDLVFFRTYASYPSHVGIYLGNNLFIHASSKSKKVTIDSLNTPFYLKRFIGAKRLLDISAKSHDAVPEG